MKLLNTFKDKLTYLLTALVTYYYLALGGVWQAIPIVNEFGVRTTSGEKTTAYVVTVLVLVAMVYPLALLSTATIREIQDKRK